MTGIPLTPLPPKEKKNNEINHTILLRCSIKKKRKERLLMPQSHLGQSTKVMSHKITPLRHSLETHTHKHRVIHTLGG